jgi:hypothetical protein
LFRSVLLGQGFCDVGFGRVFSIEDLHFRLLELSGAIERHKPRRAGIAVCRVVYADHLLTVGFHGQQVALDLEGELEIVVERLG